MSNAFFLGFNLIVTAFLIVSGWKLFSKAGVAGWKWLVPVYNLVQLVKLSGNSGWMALGYFVPFVNLYFSYKVSSGLSKAFGRGMGTTLGMMFLTPIFVPVLAFGKAQYHLERRKAVEPPPFRHHLNKAA